MKLFLAMLVGGLGALFALSRVGRIDGCVHQPCVTSPEGQPAAFFTSWAISFSPAGVSFSIA